MIDTHPKKQFFFTWWMSLRIYLSMNRGTKRCWTLISGLHDCGLRILELMSCTFSPRHPSILNCHLDLLVSLLVALCSVTSLSHLKWKSVFMMFFTMEFYHPKSNKVWTTEELLSILEMTSPRSGRAGTQTWTGKSIIE